MSAQNNAKKIETVLMHQQSSFMRDGTAEGKKLLKKLL